MPYVIKKKDFFSQFETFFFNLQRKKRQAEYIFCILIELQMVLRFGVISFNNMKKPV